MTDIFKSADWAKEALEREEEAKRGPPFIVSDVTLQAILSDPVAMKELMRPNGILVIDDPSAIPGLNVDQIRENVREWLYGGPVGGSMSKLTPPTRHGPQ